MLLTVTNQNTLLTVEDNTVVLSIMGNQGPSGSTISTYAVRVDQFDSTTLYRGEAQAGSAEGIASWRIQKFVIVGDDVTITWASGNTTFDKIWTNRLSYSYS